MVLQGPQECLERWELEGSLALEASLDYLVLQEFQAPRDPKELREMKVLSGLLDPLASLATKDLSARLALLDP